MLYAETGEEIHCLWVIGCIKQAGVSILETRVYMKLAAQGDASIGARRETLINRITEMQHTLEMVEYTCWYCEMAQEAGTMGKMQAMPEENVAERFHAI